MKKYEILDMEIVEGIDVISTSGPTEDYEGEIDWT